jgi:integrase/recombinase XerD
MTVSNLNFFESPRLPASDFPGERQQAYPPGLRQPPSGDLRWMRVEQWLSAKSLAPNTQRSYIKELKRFWNWTDKAWSQITTWDVTCYKQHLETETVQDPETAQPRRQLSPNSVALAVRSLKSFFLLDASGSLHHRQSDASRKCAQ